MKTEVVRVRLTELEKQKLMDHAESMNMSMSDYIKYCCLVEPPLKIKVHFQSLESVKNGHSCVSHFQEEVDVILK